MYFNLIKTYVVKAQNRLQREVVRDMSCQAASNGDVYFFFFFNGAVYDDDALVSRA